MIGSRHSPVDIYIPACSGSLGRTYQLNDPGVFRLARRDCVFYSVMIAASGSFGSVVVRTGTGRPIWSQPSSFTGSFVVNGFAEGGLVVEAWMEARPFVTISWREPDDKIV